MLYHITRQVVGLALEHSLVFHSLHHAHWCSYRIIYDNFSKFLFILENEVLAPACVHACVHVGAYVFVWSQVGESMNLETLSILLRLISLYIGTCPGGYLTDTITVHICFLRSIAVGLEAPVSQMMCFPSIEIPPMLCNNYSFRVGALGVLACFEMESPSRSLCIILAKA